MSQLQIELILALFAAVVALGVLAQWLRVAYPILLVVAGLLLGFQPWVPEYQLSPDVVFFLFLPPLLYAAAFNTEWSAFRTQLRAITLLAVGLVLFTAAGVAVAGHYLLDLPWAVGFVLGAIVSPPDAVAAQAITRNIRVPRIVTTILEGESLVNDASALVLLRVAVAAVGAGVGTATEFSMWGACCDFVLVSVGGVVIGLAGAWLAVRLHRWLGRAKLADAKLTIAITLLTPYAVYLPAEHLHVSGVLAVVTAGLWVGSRCEAVFDHDLYIEARSVWEMVEFALNGVIFLLIGLQLPVILQSLSGPYSLAKLVVAAAAISGVVIVARIVWVFPGAYVPRWLDRKIYSLGDPYPPARNVAVVAWTGMRGVVSLAAALAIPEKLSDKVTPFPHRDAIQLVTFGVIFATLVGQGLTLPLLIRWLKVDELAATEDADDDREEVGE